MLLLWKIVLQDENFSLNFPRYRVMKIFLRFLQNFARQLSDLLFINLTTDFFLLKLFLFYVLNKFEAPNRTKIFSEGLYVLMFFHGIVDLAIIVSAIEMCKLKSNFKKQAALDEQLVNSNTKNFAANIQVQNFDTN